MTATNRRLEVLVDTMNEARQIPQFATRGRLTVVNHSAAEDEAFDMPGDDSVAEYAGVSR